MSLMERSGVPIMPVTAVAWASNSSTCPKDFTMINITEDGAAANFTRSFVKAGYYLCYCKHVVSEEGDVFMFAVAADLSGGMVVSDVRVISDKEAIPHGYCYIPEHLEPKASVTKKKRVCVRVVPVGSVETAVLDIKLTAKSKMMLQHYTCVGDIHGYVMWCKKGQFSGPMPQAKPRSLSLDLRKLSLESPPLPLRPSNPPPLPPGKLSQRRVSLQVMDTKDTKESDTSNIYGITAIDGVPFSLHPKYDVQTNGMTPQLNTSHLSNIRIKSVQDIENEYNYTFTVEESAAKRTRPSVPTGDVS